VLFDIDKPRLDAVAADLGQRAIVVDVSAEDSVSAGVDAAADILGGIDGLVNAAGILVTKPFWETDIATFNRLMAVNVGGPLLMCTKALPHLRRAGAATIVNISSMAGLRAVEGLAAYSATKGALLRLTEAIAMEAGPGIRANCICPGVIRTPMTEQMFTDGLITPASLAVIASLERAGTPTEVADAALYLTSDESSYVTKAALRVDGGQR
jgi:NAD(P)-dependent dehydrogenase (short-subunit alcohol dehydrogenase family)